MDVAVGDQFGVSEEPKVLPTEDVSIDYAICAEDVPLQRGTLVIPVEDLTATIA
jgi:hypothetical protein